MENLLGEKTEYKDQYTNSLLYPISRKLARDQIGLISGALPFHGFDIWNCYEVSWLNLNGKPEVRILGFVVNCDSPNIIESKSLKLYFNSFNNSKFKNITQVKELIENDLSKVLGAVINISINDLQSYNNSTLQSFEGINLDILDVVMNNFVTDDNLPRLFDDGEKVEEVLYSNLLKSNCLVTNQPDWASVQISYKGKKIDHNSLLKYLISFRNHNEFHEQCVERIFCDIKNFCSPDELTVYARYTRRGGIDINPIRSSMPLDLSKISNLRHVRQ
ncbi:MAG: NADPH-dependent 7-cyano-7-deazaguanine reductase QueF [Rickettsia endosymbiont of Bryobia graminum]|nr:NADPH-dependent 7-cyano-7-deazaguanine reductase QueF [Rickettsia endosymbiont of Bryobia graminum]